MMKYFIQKSLFIWVSVFFLCISYRAQASDYEYLDSSRPLTIPTDPTGKYDVLSLQKKEEMRILLTERVGSSGVTYSKILINCNTMKFKGLGEGETLYDVNVYRPTDRFYKIIPESIKYYEYKYVCSK